MYVYRVNSSKSTDFLMLVCLKMQLVRYNKIRSLCVFSHRAGSGDKVRVSKSLHMSTG